MRTLVLRQEPTCDPRSMLLSERRQYWHEKVEVSWEAKIGLLRGIDLAEDVLRREFEAEAEVEVPSFGFFVVRKRLSVDNSHWTYSEEGMFL